jgi:hypothetical protein
MKNAKRTEGIWWREIGSVRVQSKTPQEGK